ncbi:MAG: HNH endonuclease [Flavobacterium sp. JAD_PAG50586_2]|nr:MAG: HNH endonuclease [Flavobacterium sp. JAD_PAG50586_2]
MTKICLYCKEEKEIKEFSQEHVLPRGVGGNLINNPFSIKDVCARCNNLCGLFVDGPFIKSWFTNNYRSKIAQQYCHLTPETVLPLSYMGEIEDLKSDNEICDFWLGPTGDTIYHFHKPYPDDLDTPNMIGIPPTAYKKDIDPGYVFLFVKSNNPLWHPTIVFSVISNFKKSKLYLGNGPKPNLEQFENIPEQLSDLHSKLTEKQEEMHNNTFTISIDYADRFLCKLALGMGSLVLKPEFKLSADADLLRKGLWTKNKDERKELKIHGANFLGDKESKKIWTKFLRGLVDTH